MQIREKRKIKTYRKIKVPRGYLTLKKECWKLWSEKIRREEKGVCFTCLAKKDWRKCHAGHYKHGCMDFVRKNIHCQCERCNKWLHGNLDLYSLRLEEKYGYGIIQELEKLKWTTYEPTYEELLKLREELKKELNEMRTM